MIHRSDRLCYVATYNLISLSKNSLSNRFVKVVTLLCTIITRLIHERSSKINEYKFSKLLNSTKKNFTTVYLLNSLRENALFPMLNQHIVIEFECLFQMCFV